MGADEQRKARKESTISNIVNKGEEGKEISATSKLEHNWSHHKEQTPFNDDIKCKLLLLTNKKL